MEGGNEQYGRVQASVHGIWGSLCDNYWDNKDADVFCRQMGYNTGEAYYGKYKTDNYGTIWEVNLRCLGDEDSLNMCVHEGWKNVTSMQCMNHKDSAGVFCYSNGKFIYMNYVDKHLEFCQRICKKSKFLDFKSFNKRKCLGNIGLV